MVSLLKFTVLRIALFVAALWVLRLLGAGRLGALLGAALVSFLLSYVLLRGPREQLAIEIANRVDHRHERVPSAADEDAALEDAAVEGTSLEGTSLEGTSLEGTSLEGTSLEDARVEDPRSAEGPGRRTGR